MKWQLMAGDFAKAFVACAEHCRLTDSCISHDDFTRYYVIMR